MSGKTLKGIQWTGVLMLGEGGALNFKFSDLETILSGLCLMGFRGWHGETKDALVIQFIAFEREC